MLNIIKIWKWIVYNLSVVFMRLNWFVFILLNGMFLNCNLLRINFFFKCFDFWGKIIFVNKKSIKKDLFVIKRMYINYCSDIKFMKS